LQVLWGGLNSKRCKPQELVANCGEIFRPDSTRARRTSATRTTTSNKNKNKTKGRTSSSSRSSRSGIDNHDDDDGDNAAAAVRAKYSSALVVQMPTDLKYHTNFSVSAPLFRAAYAHQQVRPHRTQLREFGPQGNCDAC
jgi:hypothetical protein